MKRVKILVATFFILISAVSFNLVAFAEPVEDDFIIEIEPTEEEKTTNKVTEPTTKAPTTTKKPTTTKNTYTPVYTPSYEETDDGFSIKLVLNNDEDDIEAEVDEDGKVTVPSAPVKEGFKFDGWYSDEEFTKRWDFLESVATEDTVLYAKWVSELDDNLYSITVSTNLGGTITVSPKEAKEGEKVKITITADEGKQVVENSLSVNGKFTDELTFTMPAENVIVEAQFEDVIVAAEDEKNKDMTDNIGKIVTIGAIVLVVIIIIIWLIVNRYRFLPEEEEDELFFVEPLSSNQAPIRHDDFVRKRNNQRRMENAAQADDLPDDIMNEAEIRTITKTGNINLDQ